MDSREGNWDTDTEDFYLAKVDFDATGAAPRRFVDESDAIARSVALSKIGYPAGNEGALVGGARDPANAAADARWRRRRAAPLRVTPRPVVIVNETDVAGAMAGTVLARANPGPVLLSAAAGLSAAVKAEITRMRPARVFLIGDTTKLSSDRSRPTPQVAAGLLTPQVIRIAGANDADTAAQIAAQMDYRTTTEKDNTNPALRPAFDAAVIVESCEPGRRRGRRPGRGTAAPDPVRRPELGAGGDGDRARHDRAGHRQDARHRRHGIGQRDRRDPGCPAPRPAWAAPTSYATSQAVVTESKARGLPSNIVYVADGPSRWTQRCWAASSARATGMLLLAPAPLYDTAATQAATFGLTGISRYWLLGPAQVVAPPPPPPPPPPVVVPPPRRHRRPRRRRRRRATRPAPTARLSGALIQKLGLTAGRDGVVHVGGMHGDRQRDDPGPRVGRIAAQDLQAQGRQGEASPRAPSASSRSGSRRRCVPAIKRAQKARKVVSVKFTIKVTDTAGNARSLRRTVRLKR